MGEGVSRMFQGHSWCETQEKSIPVTQGHTPCSFPQAWGDSETPHVTLLRALWKRNSLSRSVTRDQLGNVRLILSGDKGQI